jgi:hypothetical protein
MLHIYYRACRPVSPALTGVSDLVRGFSNHFASCVHQVIVRVTTVTFGIPFAKPTAPPPRWATSLQATHAFLTIRAAIFASFSLCLLFPGLRPAARRILDFRSCPHLQPASRGPNPPPSPHANANVAYMATALPTTLNASQRSPKPALCSASC